MKFYYDEYQTLTPQQLKMLEAIKRNKKINIIQHSRMIGKTYTKNWFYENFTRDRTPNTHRGKK